MAKADTFLNSSSYHNNSMLPPSPSSSSSSLPLQLTDSTLPNPPSYYDNNPDAKNILIQQATTRLRCRLLYDGLGQVKSRVADLQTELDNLRIELDTTENVLSKFGDQPDDRQLQALERRFNAHQQQLDHVLTPIQHMPPTARPPTPPDSHKMAAKPSTSTSTITSALSRMSSIFRSQQQKRSTKNIATLSPVTTINTSSGYQPLELSPSPSPSSSTTSSDYNSDTATPSVQEARERRKLRRQRVKQLRQEYQDRLRSYDPNWNQHGDWKPTQHSSTPPSANDNIITINDDTTPTTSMESTTLLNQPQQSEPQPSKSPKEEQRNQQHSTTLRTIGKRKAGPTTPTKKSMTTSTASPTQSKPPIPAQCLCKRKTNKPELTKHHKAASSTSRTYHSKQPEMASLETQKQQAPPLDMSGEIKSEKNQPPQAPPTALSGPLHHPTASVTPVTENLDTPPCPPNVTEWLSKQQAYQQHDDLMDTKEQQDEPLGNHDPFTMKQPAAFKEDETDQLPSKVYEDILRYLDTYSDIGNDIGLQQDITCILSPLDYQQQPNGRAKSTWSSSSSSITSSSSLSTPSYDGYYWRAHHSSSSVYHQMRLYSLLANHGMTRLSRYLLDGIKKGLSWCKFLSVLSIALLISLGRGPNHMLLSLDDLDYLEWLADQEDGYVDSYCL